MGQLEKQPEWNERFKGWAAKFIAKNLWRCDPIDNFSDHMQDAYLMYRHILASYPEISDPKHIMALYQRAMINDYNDRARYKQRKTTTEVSFETTIGEDLKLVDKLGEYNNQGYLNILLSQLPHKTKLAIKALQDCNVTPYLQKDQVAGGASSLKKEPSNSALCQIIGLPKGTNLLEVIYSALLKDEENMSNSVHPIEQELLALTGFMPEKKYRKRQTYLTALMRAVDALNDAEFEKLSDDAADWVDRSVQAFKGGTDLPDFEGGEPNGHAHHATETVEAEYVEVVEEEVEGEQPAIEVEHNVQQKKARKPRKAKDASTAAPRVPRASSPSVGTNKWGVANGTKAATVCELIARPQGATMEEIKNVTGQTQYNVVNRLQRKGHHIVKEGLVIKLLDHA